MQLEQRIEALEALGNRIRSIDQEEKDRLNATAVNENAWFTSKSINTAFKGLIEFLKPNLIEAWLSDYSIRDQGRSVGIVMAGNIPMVGFHDLLCVLLSGNKAMVKLSSSDSILVRQLIQWLVEIDPVFHEVIAIEERLNKAAAIIATGSDNTARYFKYYFGKKPYIIRQNRTSVAVLTGKESEKEIRGLADDIFTYYGLGCRNVSKLFLPVGFDFQSFLDQLSNTPHQNITEHHKYRNNYDYNKSIYLVNGDEHLDTGFALLKSEKSQLVSPISVLYYDTYESPQQLQLTLAGYQDKIQCVVSSAEWLDTTFSFGETQTPQLNDYADGVDTMQFLSNLK